MRSYFCNQEAHCSALNINFPDAKVKIFQFHQSEFGTYFLTDTWNRFIPRDISTLFSKSICLCHDSGKRIEKWLAVYFLAYHSSPSFQNIGEQMTSYWNSIIIRGNCTFCMSRSIAVSSLVSLLRVCGRFAGNLPCITSLKSTFGMSALLFLIASKVWRSRFWGWLLEPNSVANFLDDVERYKLRHVVIALTTKMIITTLKECEDITVLNWNFLAALTSRAYYTIDSLLRTKEVY